MREAPANPHCHLIQAGEIQAIVGDASRDGAGGPQYCGLWSLTSEHRAFNAFGNSFAGLIPGDIRGKAPTLMPVDDTTCELVRAADDRYPVDARATYRASAPYYIDHEFVITDRADTRREGCSFREVSWCCYMNSPEDSRLNFLSSGEWHRYISPRHGVGSSIAPAYIPDDQLEVWPNAGSWQEERRGKRPFHWDRYEKRFDQPFYYGRLRDMALILVFDAPRWLRFFCSPSGGGTSLLPGKSCPAWDFLWLIPESHYEVGREYRFRVRLIYTPFISDDDVLAALRRTQDELGFEKVTA